MSLFLSVQLREERSREPDHGSATGQPWSESTHSPVTTARANQNRSPRPITGMSVGITQQTQNICITFIQGWTNVEDIVPTLHKCYTNVSCLLGTRLNYLEYNNVDFLRCDIIFSIIFGDAIIYSGPYSHWKSWKNHGRVLEYGK